MALKDKFASSLASRTGLSAESAADVLSHVFDLVKTKVPPHIGSLLDRLLASPNGIDHAEFSLPAAAVVAAAIAGPAPVPTLEAVMAAGYGEAAARDIIAREQERFDRESGKIAAAPQPAPAPAVSSQPAPQAPPAAPTEVPAPEAKEAAPDIREGEAQQAAAPEAPASQEAAPAKTTFGAKVLKGAKALVDQALDGK